MIHKKCGTEIVEFKNDKGKDFHPFFVGYCPICDYAVPLEDCVEGDMKK